MKQVLSLALAVLFAHGDLTAQDSKVAAASKWQAEASPNDERVKVFVELETKAEAGDLLALRQVGEYYFNGSFPVTQNQETAKALWIKGANLGDDQCANLIYMYAFPASYDTEVVIEKTKWMIIQAALRMKKSKSTPREASRPNGISESSFQEAKERAEAFLSKVTINSQETQAGAANSNSALGESKLSALKFGSLGSFDEHRRKVCAAYLKAASPIYSKGEAANKEEKVAFTVAALELARLQTYVGKRRSLLLISNKNDILKALNTEKVNEAYGKMAAAEIKTALPVTRAELNEASKYMNALGDLMRLPVKITGSY